MGKRSPPLDSLPEKQGLKHLSQIKPVDSLPEKQGLKLTRAVDSLPEKQGLKQSWPVFWPNNDIAVDSLPEKQGLKLFCGCHIGPVTLRPLTLFQKNKD
jgi:hypothetical protein